MKDHHQYYTKRCLDIAKHWLLEIFAMESSRSSIHRTQLRPKAAGVRAARYDYVRNRLRSHQEWSGCQHRARSLTMVGEVQHQCIHILGGFLSSRQIS
eukprot:1640395-Amphidinium_carterae.2